MSTYRPPNRSAHEAPYTDQDHPSSESARVRDFDRSDPHSERQEQQARDAYRDDGARGRPAYPDRGGYRQYDRPPPAKRPYHGPDRYEDDDDPYAEPPVEIPYRGENDISQDGRPMRLLLIRNLKESMSEDLFAKGLEKLYLDPGATPAIGPPTGATEGSLRRVLIVRDRFTDKSMHYGFAEYHSISDATAALAKAEAMGEKCTIASKAVEITFPHLSVFPRADFGRKERSEKYTVEMSSTGQQHKYHDERYYATEFMVNRTPPGSSPAKSGESGDQVGPNTLEGKDKSKKRKAPGTTAPAFLQHWQNKATELRTEVQKAQDAKEKERADIVAKPPASGVNAIATPVASEQQTFAVDTSKLRCCYLCACQFQTSEGLQRHLRESGKHAENLVAPDAAAKGHERLKKAGVSLDATIKLLLPSTARPATTMKGAAADDDAYRDRAAERRRFVSHTSTSASTSTSTNDPNSKGPSFSLKPNNNKTSNPRTASPAPAPVPPAQPSYGKGMALLHKAGWSAGQSLGRSGEEGVTAPIEQSLYARGVGLGHEGAKVGDAVVEAERMTKGGGGGEGFVEKTREVARKRFGGLG
ncbi:hypothetical protein LTR53_014591 [Teratosphaeriaceae sp. CCFEE 6253]|nr:hypothetical protein LTR53_014591 [Teratosphaeriaceae sp. CCFEE 6253]